MGAVQCVYDLELPPRLKLDPEHLVESNIRHLNTLEEVAVSGNFQRRDDRPAPESRGQLGVLGESKSVEGVA